MPYPINQMDIPQFFEESFIEDLIKKMNDPTKIELTKNVWFLSSIPFNNVSSGYQSIIFRQTSPSSLPYMGLTFELFRNGNVKIIIPFIFIQYESELDSNAWKTLISKLEEEDITLFRIIDGLKTLNIFIVLLQKYFDVLKSQGWHDDILIILISMVFQYAKKTVYGFRQNFKKSIC